VLHDLSGCHAMSEFFPRTPLNEDELRQLQELLGRYLWNHAAGLANKAIDAAIDAFKHKFQKAYVSEPL
jgi:hypothetical protein